ncbi:MAG: trigger factor [Deltaproteobacteria bacterium]|nr:trigger factor [Deltaproteobacteria bacterium]
MQNSVLNFDCKVENKSAIVRELTISVKPDSIQAYIEKQFETLQKTAKIKGFRPGKVPLPILKKHYLGEVKSDVFSKVVQDSYSRAIEENKINPIGNPKIEAKSGAGLTEGEALTFIASVEILPEIKVADLSKIKVARPSSDVRDEDVKNAIENLRRAQAEIAPDEGREGPLKDGDLVQLTYSGTIEGKADESLKGANRLLKVGAGQYVDGFEKNILGMKKGETRKFTVTHAGKNAEFEVTLHEFKKENLPELNDELAQRFKADTVAELRKKVAADMTSAAERKARNTLKERLIEALIEANKIEIPSHFLDTQFDHLIRENARALLQQGYTEKMVREYLEKNQENLKSRAEKQVRATLLLDKIALDNDLKVEDADLEREYAKIAEAEKVDLAEVKKFFDNENARRELRFRLKEEKTFDFLIEKVKVSLEK